MPIYEYQCRSCGHRFEQMQKVSDAPLRKCPECSGRLEKLISRTAFLLKGGGWYAHGYSNTSESGDAKDGGKKDSAKAESKSDPNAKNKKKDAKDKGGNGSASGSAAAS
jgi:putative FmdB family regulatory protein